MSSARDPLDEALDAGLDRLVAFYETLTPASLERLGLLYAADARFKDPFNEVVGVPAIARIFRHMFEQAEAPGFRVSVRLREGRQAMLGWSFAFGPPARRITVRGVSHLLLDVQGRVVEHLDYWDAAGELYAKLPWIGALMRWLRRRLSAAQA